MRTLYLLSALAFALLAPAFADTVTLKNGRVINGNYMGGTPRQVKVEIGDMIETLDVNDIAKIEFGGWTKAAKSEEPPRLRRTPILRPDDAEVAKAAAHPTVELPTGTPIMIRMIDAVDSAVNRTGQTFRASLDEAVLVSGNEVLPRGADAIVKLVEAHESGKLTGRTTLTLRLVGVQSNGKVVDINTESVSQASSSRGARTAKVAGGTAAAGAIIGAIAGGGRGAAIGAGAGAAAGTGAEVLTGGQRVKIPAETRLTFTTETPVKI